MRLDLDSDPEVALGGDLDADVANHSETLAEEFSGITIRWRVEAGPIAGDTRVVTVRVVNLRAQQYRQTNLATIIRE